MIVIQVSCNSNPASPGKPGDTGGNSTSDITVSSRNLIGSGSMVFNKETGEVEIVPSRTGDVHVNITGLINNTMGLSLVSVPAESDPLNGLFVLDMTIAHPLPGKPQFSIFDVKFILMTPGTLAIPPLVFADIDETRLLYPDGYTRWWNPTEFTTPGPLGYIEGIIANATPAELTATVNPYKQFADILNYNSNLSPMINEPLDSDLGRGVFRDTSSNTRRMYFKFPTTPALTVKIGYAIDCSWDFPDPIPPGEIPDDFPIEANQPEPYYIFIQSYVNTLNYDTDTGIGGGILKLRINVSDWQGQAAGNIADEINTVRVFCPDLFTGGISAVFLEETATKASYLVDLTGLTTVTEAGEVLLVVRVGSSDGSTYVQGAADGPDAPLSSYHAVPIVILDLECYVDNNNDFSEAYSIGSYGTTTGQVCYPDDEFDYYYFDTAPGFDRNGEIRLTADHLATLGFYDGSGHLLAMTDTSSGTGVIVLDDMPLMPEDHYIQIGTVVSTQVVPYLLEIYITSTKVTPDIPSLEITPVNLFAKADRVYRTHTHTILTSWLGCWVYDIHDYTYEPEMVFASRWNIGTDADIFGSRLYFMENTLPEGAIIDLLDFSDPANPVLYESVYSGIFGMKGIALTQTHMFVGAPQVIGTDVTIFQYSGQPHMPVEVASIDHANQPEKLDIMYSSGETILIVGGSNKIIAFDVTDLEAITEVGSYDRPPGIFTDMYASFLNVIYTIYNTSTNKGYLYILEYTGSDLVEAGMIELPGEATSVQTWSQNAFIGDGAAGLTICDYLDPADIQIDSTTFLGADAMDVSILGDVLNIIPENSPMQVFNVASTTNPQFKSELPVVNNPRKALVKDDYMLIHDWSGYTHTIKTVDISDPANAFLAGKFPLSDWMRTMAIEGDIMVACKSYGFQILNAADPANLFELYSGSYTNIPVASSIHGNTLYITYDAAKVLIYDITNPSSPAYIANYTLQNKATGFAYSGIYMYLSTDTGVDVYNISDPLAPVFMSHYSTPEVVEEMVTQGHKLYLATTTRLEVVDISSPGFPNYAGAVVVHPNIKITQLVVDGQFAYVQGNTSGAYAIAVFPYDSPSVVGEVNESLFLSFTPIKSELVLKDGVLYDMNQITGIRAFDLY